ncbi:TPA: hypothetical protein H1012_02240 [archaeon]|nr:hypothetical protein [Candidatus Naiadarchaeales archaeon SRR2090159.bin1288]
MAYKYILTSSVFLLFVVGAYLYASTRDILKTEKAAIYVYNNLFDILLIILSVSGIIGLVEILIPAGYFANAFTSFPKLALTAVGGTFLGSITAGPPILSYPIAKAMIDEGIIYGVVAGFISAWGLLDPISLPAEIHYLGKKFAFWRAAFSFLIAIAAGFAVIFIV